MPAMHGKVTVEGQLGVQVLFNEVKMFWRSHVTVNVVIALHELPNCLEVIVYHPELDKESSRIYLNASLIRHHVDEILDSRAQHDKERSVQLIEPFDVRSTHHTKRDALIVEYILSRLHPMAAGDELIVELRPHFRDNINPETNLLDTLLETPPANLQSLNVKKATKCMQFSSKDFAAALHEQSCELRRATNIATIAASTERILLQQALYRKFSVARVRWIKAIRRVIVQLEVQKVRALLHELRTKKRSSKASRSKQDSNGLRRPRILRYTIDHLPGIASPAKAVHASPSTPEMKRSALQLPYVDIRNYKAPSKLLTPESTAPVSSQRRAKSMTMDGSPVAPRISSTYIVSMPALHHHRRSCGTIDRCLSSPDELPPSVLDCFAAQAGVPLRPTTAPAYTMQQAIAITLNCASFINPNLP